MKPLVTDAASREQYKEAKQKTELRISQKQRDLQAVLATPEGRRVIWSLLQRAGVFESIWENSAKIHYNAGQQDFGHALMADIVDAGEEFFFTMMTENRKDKK